MLILDAADRVSAHPVAADHAGTGTGEDQALCGRTGHGPRPIVAVGADTDERTPAADARHGHFERGVERPGRIIAAPTGSLGNPLGFGWQTVASRTRVVDSVYTLP